jgi:hypothetical protein
MGSPGVIRVTTPGGTVKRKEEKKVKLAIAPFAAETLSLENPPRKRRFNSGEPEQPQHLSASGRGSPDSRSGHGIVVERGEL